MIRKADIGDLGEIGQIYDKIHTNEEKGITAIGWVRGIYPTVKTAERAIKRGDMFVSEKETGIIACVVIDRLQAPEYEKVPFTPAASNEVMVLHTLAVDPECQGRGCGSEIVGFYEKYARENNCKYLRMDTNRTNAAARAFYKKNGFREIAEIPYYFEGIPNLKIVCLEKEL